MTIQTIQDWCEFGEFRAYVLMGIARRKHNEELTNSTEIIYRKVLRNQDHIERKYNEMKTLIDQHDYLFRIYLTVNARDTRKAFFNFQKRLNGWSEGLYNGDDAIPEKLGKIDSHWISEVHKPQSKDDQFFLFDLDDVTWNEEDLFRDELEDYTDVVVSQETPNGYHLVTEPFNHTRFEPEIEYDEMDTDGQLFIEEITIQ